MASGRTMKAALGIGFTSRDIGTERTLDLTASPCLLSKARKAGKGKRSGPESATTAGRLVKWIHSYGFVSSPHGDVFLHKTQLPRDVDPTSLSPGTPVRYQLATNDNGRIAVNCELVGTAEPTRKKGKGDAQVPATQQPRLGKAPGKRAQAKAKAQARKAKAQARKAEAQADGESNQQRHEAAPTEATSGEAGPMDLDKVKESLAAQAPELGKLSSTQLRHIAAALQGAAQTPSSDATPQKVPQPLKPGEDGLHPISAPEGSAPAALRYEGTLETWRSTYGFLVNGGRKVFVHRSSMPHGHVPQASRKYTFAVKREPNRSCPTAFECTP
eukprot:gene10300-65_t